MSSYLLGIDIGTSSCKAAVFHENGNLVAESDSQYPSSCPFPGYAEQNPEDWWRGAINACRDAVSKSQISPKNIDAVGVAGQSWAMAPVDAHGSVLQPSPLWNDTRSQAECDEILAIVGESRLFGCCHNPCMPGYTSPKVLFMKKHFPENYQRTVRVLGSNGYIVWKLTGVMTQDYSQGYGWSCFNMEHLSWDKDLCREMGINPGLLPQLVPCSMTVGKVTCAAAIETGLCPGTPVVAGGLDAACAALGVGVIKDGQCQEQGGQAGGMSICTESPSGSPKLILSPHVVDGKYLLQGGTTGGSGTMRHLQKELFPGVSFEELSEIAAKSPAGANGLIFLPFMSGERSPLWESKAKAVIYGMSFASSKEDIVRCVMEGVAYSLRHNLETAAGVIPSPKALRTSGGASRSHIWTQIKADVTGCPVEDASSSAATARGAAMLAGIGAGIYSSPEEAAASIRVTNVYTPDSQNHRLYSDRYRLYIQLIDKLLPIMREQG